ncbi:MAG TPA: class I SAM-dependent methyltransferase [Candidatus Glassbacteria bacterium]|nr:class I SAM-dependent methyltransferase [Candidatus Glassbacteria bacterium]
MKKYRILNLYACLGGNRYKWDEVADNLDVVAVELDKDLAEMYQERFPNDTVIVADAHEYLLNHFKEFDFIWSSPPCPTHSKVRISQKNREEFDFKFPDMKLYEEVIFLDNFFGGKWCVENVIPYYEPLIQAQKRGRHLYWTNFRLLNSLNERKQPKDFIMTGSKPNENFHEIDLTNYKGEQRKDKIARNLVDYEAGRTILETAMEIQRQNNTRQVSLFDALK